MDRYEFMILILMGCIESGANVIYVYTKSIHQPDWFDDDDDDDHDQYRDQ